MDGTTEEQRIENACKRWVDRDFANIPGSLIERAFKENRLELIAGADYCSECCTGPEECEDPENHPHELEYWPAMWGTLFHPNDSCDENWIRENLKAVVGCGFHVFDSEETGILLGVNGAGYSFYDNHWIPLYKARGLSWHEPGDKPTPKKVWVFVEMHKGLMNYVRVHHEEKDLRDHETEWLKEHGYKDHEECRDDDGANDYYSVDEVEIV